MKFQNVAKHREFIEFLKKKSHPDFPKRPFLENYSNLAE
jgi:hypothetical protein